MIDRSLLQNIDWILIALLLLNSIIGVAFIYSSSHYLPGNYYVKQIIWIVISFIVLFLFLSIDYKTIVIYSPYFYIASIVMLGGLLLLGRFEGGVRSWIKFPFIQIQPSEITKIMVILILAYVFSEFKMEHLSRGKGVLGGIIIAVPVMLVALQPDLGTALSYVPIFLASLILAGLKKKTLVFLLVFILLLGFVGWNFGLKDYQKERLKTLVFPGQDPLGSGYHILQSKIAIGSGGLLGKGYREGTQSQLRFLPARHTDFIFSVIGEELGFIGVVIVISFYFFFLLRLFRSIGKSRDRAGVYVIYMVAVMIAAQFFINVMMVVGLFPITGIPLPLLSYGGSSLLTNYLGVSLVLNVKMRRFVNI
ncbi:MAG: rod shape-determining protein RodA [Candidatus Aminicenantes bacterium]|nr:MAG: rod shape-determining protein RodA [Candidatus Aminicenantes bacterium]